MFRVLHIIPGADAGGISTVVVNYYKYINKEKIHFDVALTTNMVGKNAEILQSLGAKIYFLPLKSQGIRKFQKELADLLIKEKYDALHVHENETSYIALRVAKKIGIKYRFAHAHSTSPYTSLRSEIRRLSGCVLNYYYATKMIACGKLAGERIFGKNNMKKSKSVVLPNAVEVEKFAFSLKDREQMRNQLDFQSKYVIGMVGRLSTEKNQIWGLEIMRDIHKIIPEAILVIAGNGSDEEKLREYIKEYQMDEYVSLLGARNDVSKLYQMFDLFMLPSLHEGFPVVAVEAMAAGLPIVLSDTITKELSFSQNVYYLPLEDKKAWITAIREFSYNRDNVARRKNAFLELKSHNLEIRDSAAELEKIYLDGNIR